MALLACEAGIEKMRKVIAGNWKMNHGPDGTRAFLDQFGWEQDDGGARILLFVPALSLTTAGDQLGTRSAIGLGVQNIHWEPAGAFTGEISAEMAAAAGAGFALVGHSERRSLFGETDLEAARKVSAAQRAGITPVLCVGETLEERAAGRLEEVVARQLEPVLGTAGSEPVRGIEADSHALMVAYEPVWAIGTGRTATPEDAGAAHGFIRGQLAAALGAVRSQSIPILYGGSVGPENAAALLRVPDVNGVLVGGASLDAVSFARIAAAAG